MNVLIQEIREKYRTRNIPWIVHFELTHCCNLDCIHCYIPSHNDVDALTTSEIKSVIDQLHDIGAVLLTFSGGEIFLRDDLFEILRYASKNFLIVLLSNGTLIKQHHIKQLKELGIVQIEVSLYGASEQVHDRITRVPGSYVKVMETISFLRKEHIPFLIKSCLMKHNENDVEEIRRIALQLGSRVQISTLLTPKTDGSRSPLTHHANEHRQKTYLSQLIKEQTNGIDNYPNTLDAHSRDSKKMCGAGSYFCNIAPSGLVSPCTILPINIGSLREHSFRDIWLDNPDPELERLRSLRSSDLLQCQNCDLSDQCSPCLGQNYLETQDVLKCSAHFCRISHWISNGLSHSKKGGQK